MRSFGVVSSLLMMDRYSVALAQINPQLGNVQANLSQYEESVREARGQGADLVVFPELSLTGYHLKDEVPVVAQALDGAIFSRLRELASEISILVGFVEEGPDHRFFNSAAYLERGEVVHVHRKAYLPTYGMFDENRYFARGQRIRAFDTRLGRMAALVCEDLWHPSTAHIAALDGATILICPSSSPIRGLGGPADDSEPDENARTWELLNRTYATLYGIFLVYVNRVGFEDGVGFWGGSEVIAPGGKVVAKAPYYEPSLLVAEIEPAAVRRNRLGSPLLRDENIDLTLRELERLRQEAP